jgi:hypothetical protein
MSQVVDLQEVRPGVWLDEAGSAVVDRLLGGRQPRLDEDGNPWPYPSGCERRASGLPARLLAPVLPLSRGQDYALAKRLA